MDLLLVMAIVVLLLGLLGLTGAIRPLRPGSWLILVMGVLILGLWLYL